MKNCLCVVIAGCSGSGKTTIAEKLRESYSSIQPAVIGQDSFYLPVPTGMDARDFNFDVPDAYEFPLIEHTLRDLQDGKSVHIPIYDFVNNCRSGKTETLEASKLVILEGLFTLDKRLHDTVDLKVFVECSPETCLLRRIKRDTLERGRSFDSIYDQYTRFVIPGNHDHVIPSSRFADVIIRGDGNQIGFDVLKAYIDCQLTNLSG